MSVLYFTLKSPEQMYDSLLSGGRLTSGAIFRGYSFRNSAYLVWSSLEIPEELIVELGLTLIYERVLKRKIGGIK